MRKSYLAMWAAAGLLAACSAPKSEESSSADSVAMGAPTEEWISLFDGQTFNGWSKYGGGEVGKALRLKMEHFFLTLPIKMAGRPVMVVTLLQMKSLKISTLSMNGKLHQTETVE